MGFPRPPPRSPHAPAGTLGTPGDGGGARGRVRGWGGRERGVSEVFSSPLASCRRSPSPGPRARGIAGAERVEQSRPAGVWVCVCVGGGGSACLVLIYFFLSFFSSFKRVKVHASGRVSRPRPCLPAEPDLWLPDRAG